MSQPTMPPLPPQLPFPLGEELTMQLDLVQTGGVCFYSLNLLGQARINRVAATALAAQMRALTPACDVLVAAEAKSIGLVQELALLLGHDQYVILRKSRKAYMVDPLVTTVRSITTTGEQQLILDRHDIDLLQGKTACFVDDVISTGATWLAAQDLFRRATGDDFACCACVATEGKALEANPHSFVRLGHLPLYDMNGKAI
ncbi:MAG: phosphoribosyltransferase family protein [Christensenellales bacterium]|jgi:adenine phosphoribosyltransferase